MQERNIRPLKRIPGSQVKEENAKVNLPGERDFAGSVEQGSSARRGSELNIDELKVEGREFSELEIEVARKADFGRAEYEVVALFNSPEEIAVEEMQLPLELIEPSQEGALRGQKFLLSALGIALSFLVLLISINAHKKREHKAKISARPIERESTKTVERASEIKNPEIRISEKNSEASFDSILEQKDQLIEAPKRTEKSSQSKEKEKPSEKRLEETLLVEKPEFLPAAKLRNKEPESKDVNFEQLESPEFELVQPRLSLDLEEVDYGKTQLRLIELSQAEFSGLLAGENLSAYIEDSNDYILYTYLLVRDEQKGSRDLILFLDKIIFQNTTGLQVGELGILELEKPIFILLAEEVERYHLAGDLLYYLSAGGELRLLKLAAEGWAAEPGRHTEKNLGEYLKEFVKERRVLEGIRDFRLSLDGQRLYFLSDQGLEFYEEGWGQVFLAEDVENFEISADGSDLLFLSKERELYYWNPGSENLFLLDRGLDAEALKSQIYKSDKASTYYLAQQFRYSTQQQ